MAVNHQKSLAVTHTVVRVFICQEGIFLKEYLLVILLLFSVIQDITLCLAFYSSPYHEHIQFSCQTS